MVKKLASNVQLAVRIPSSLVQKVDETARRLEALSEIRVTRSDAVRFLVKKGLEAEAAEWRKKGR